MNKKTKLIKTANISFFGTLRKLPKRRERREIYIYIIYFITFIYIYIYAIYIYIYIYIYVDKIEYGGNMCTQLYIHS